jgi:hypothetical protein
MFTKLQLSWESPCRVITCLYINKVIYRIQHQSQSKYNGGTPGQTGAISRHYLGQATFRRKEWCRTQQETGRAQHSLASVHLSLKTLRIPVTHSHSCTFQNDGE